MDDKKQQIPAEILSENESLTEEEKSLLHKYAHTFIGSYAHSLDSKGRMVIPQAFREDLGKKFYLCPSLDFRAICVYTPLAWARLREQYAKLGKVSGQFMKFLNQFDALSYRDQECDGAGRILIPAKIRQIVLGDEKDVEVTGATDHVRIVSAKANAALMAELLSAGDEFAKIYDELSLRLLDDLHD